MNEMLPWVLAAAAGLVLGAIFFGGLWWTVRKGLSSPHPAVWFLGSLVARMSIALVGFYYVGQGNGMRLMACLLGFIIARIAVTWLSRTTLDTQNRTHQEVHHAP